MSFIDPNVLRKNELQKAHLEKSECLSSGEPVFSHIEFSITGLCNRKCVFCPRANPEQYPNRREFMPLESYRKILNDLSDIQYSGRLSYSGFCEPLLHKQAVDFVASSKEILPSCRVEMVTNGDPLNAKLLCALVDASLDTLLVSMYDGPGQIAHFESMVQEAGVDRDRVVLRERYLPSEEGYGIMLTNRGGMTVLEDLGVGPRAEPLKNPCYYPFYRMMVDHLGDVLLCPHDWAKKCVAGNAFKENIVDVWTGSGYSEARRSLAVGDRSFSPCDVCDVEGTYQGKEHFEKFQALCSKGES